MKARVFWVTVVVVASLSALALAAGSGSGLSNGGFEKGTFDGWQLGNKGPGGWSILGETNTSHRGILPQPIAGDFSAMSEQGDPSAGFLIHKIKLAPNRRHKLKLKMNYSSERDLKPRDDFGLGHKNQQLRIDLLRGSAPKDALDKQNLLLNVFQTEQGDPTAKATKTYTANLTPFAGKTVKLRIAFAVTEGPLQAIVDDVKVTTKQR